jgi:hypothetical protein
VSRALSRALAFVLAVLLVTVVGAAPAHAAGIASYLLSIRENPDGERLDFVMTLEYRTLVEENKSSGFKFVGDQRPTDVRAHTREGTPLQVLALREGSSGEWKLDFALSEPITTDNVHERRHVVVEFSLPRDARPQWTEERVHLEWPKNFRLEVSQVEYRIAAGLQVRDRSCSLLPSGDSLCQPRGPDTITLYRDTGAPLGAIVGTGLGLLVATLLVAGSLRLRYNTLVAMKGVLPPAPAPAYPSTPLGGPEVYRAPPPLPTPSELPPAELPFDEARAWRTAAQTAVALAAIAPIAVFMLITAVGASFSPGALMFVAFVLGAVGTLNAFDSDSKLSRSWVPILVSVLAMILAKSGILAMGLSLVGLTVLTGFGYVIKNAPASSGDGSSGSSSCGSSSSCGGGGGGCGGGGGGCGG